jgi:ATP-dependent protease ClpP protease subunit
MSKKEIYHEMIKELGVTPEEIAKKLISQRTVPLSGEINGDMAKGLRKVLLALDYKETAPITLLIDSHGGEVDEGKNILYTFPTLNSPVDGLVVGNCRSMAVDILLMCRERRALPNADFYLHFPRCRIMAIMDTEKITETDIKTITERMTSYTVESEQFYMDRLKKNRKEIKRLFYLGEKYNVHYNASQALDLGLIHKIETEYKYFKST